MSSPCHVDQHAAAALLGGPAWPPTSRPVPDSLLRVSLCACTRLRTCNSCTGSGSGAVTAGTRLLARRSGRALDLAPPASVGGRMCRHSCGPCPGTVWENNDKVAGRCEHARNQPRQQDTSTRAARMHRTCEVVGGWDAWPRQHQGGGSGGSGGRRKR